MRVVAFVTDLMDRSKITSAEFASDPGAAAGADVVVVDLGAHASVVREVRRLAPGARIVAYGRHTSPEVLRQAVDDGADEAMPRSRFFADVGSAVHGSV